MKNIEVQKLLAQFPDNMEVAILDVKKNEANQDADNESSAGIYHKFNVAKSLEDDELAELREAFPNLQNWIALEFNSEEPQGKNEAESVLL